MHFWSTVFPDIIQSYAKVVNESQTHLHDYGHGPFPPYFSESNNNVEKHGQGINLYSSIYNHESDPESTLSGMSPATIILIGCLLLFLNLLCFMGLFYQRERLKRVELQMRKRYVQGQKNDEEITPGPEEETGSIRYVTCEFPSESLRFSQNHPRLDAMSEAETENGFGPDFLGPNYDPRTKVNRWMNMQRQQNSMSLENRRIKNAKDQNSISNTSSPPAGLPYEPMSGNNSNSSSNFPSSSLQRTIHRNDSKMPPKAEQDPPVRFYPGIHPNRAKPFHPPGSDIPYVDSRNTSPSIISAPPMFNGPSFSNTVTSPKIVPPEEEIIISDFHPGFSNDTLTPNSSSKNPKRTSVLIVRDLDPIDDQLALCEPKFVPIKTGTLTRSVGVGAHSDDPPCAFINAENGEVKKPLLNGDVSTNSNNSTDSNIVDNIVPSKINHNISDNLSNRTEIPPQKETKVQTRVTFQEDL